MRLRPYASTAVTLALSALATAPTALAAVAPTDGSGGKKDPRPEVLTVASFLEGTMESTEQAIDMRGEYLPVRLTQCRVRVEGAPAEASAGAVFLYTEQAVTTTLAAPYRQRFTRLSSPVDGDTAGRPVVSSVFEPTGNKQALVGLCAKPEAERVVAFADIGTSDCSVFLKEKDGGWAGQTPRDGCPSVFRGAVRVTSEAVITEAGMSSWDRGLDKDGNQVWGPETGPYRFRKIDPATVDPEVDQIAWRLSGRFSNATQVAADSSYSKVDYDLCPVTLTGVDLPAGSRATAVRQSIALPDGRTIVRKRVYLVRAGEGASRTMEFLDFAPAVADLEPCAKPRAARAIDFKDLVGSQCVMDFAFDVAQRAYVGHTREGGCASTYQGASTLSIVGTLKASSLEIWERWFDAEGTQVAGSTKGPYVYDLQEPE